MSEWVAEFPKFPKTPRGVCGIRDGLLAHARRAKNVVRPLSPDAVDIREANLDPLRARKVDACDSCHLLSLPLLMLRIRADDPDHSTAADNLALVAHLLH